MVLDRSISVNLQNSAKALLMAGLCFVGAGCSTFSSYPLGMEQTTLAPLRSGKTPDYRAVFGSRTNGANQVLFAQEMGRTAQLAGDFEASRGAFATAIAATEEQDNRAVISARGAAAQTGAVLVNDKAIPYHAPSFERTLVHHYQALNYLMLGDLTGAGVEVRLANREQVQALEQREREVEKAKSKSEKADAKNAPASAGDERDPHLSKIYAGLDQTAGAVKSSFQNAATFFVSSVIWEMLGERNSAYIDIKKALEIAPDNPFLQRDAVRLATRLGMREDADAFAKRFPDAVTQAGVAWATRTGQARLVVIVEEGAVPHKVELSIPYPLPSSHSIGMIALPTYSAMPPPPRPLRVQLDKKNLASTEPLCSVGALAARALSEQMPAILARQLARSITKGVAAKTASDTGGSTGPLLELLVLVYNIASEQADLRSWLTLPAHVQMYSGFVDPGERSLSLASPQGGTIWSAPVTFRSDKTTLVILTRFDLAVYSSVFLQP